MACASLQTAWTWRPFWPSGERPYLSRSALLSHGTGDKRAVFKLGPRRRGGVRPAPTAGDLAPLLPRSRKLYSCCHGDRDARPVGRVWAISQLQLDKWVKLTPKGGSST